MMAQNIRKMMESSPQDALRQRHKLVHRMPYGKICPLSWSLSGFRRILCPGVYPALDGSSIVCRPSSVFCLLTSVILVVMTAGCAVSEKSPSANGFAEVSANGQDNLIDSTETFSDDEFDLLQEELDEQIVEIDDPLEPFNRLIFGVNDTLYFWVFKPVAQTYEAVAPEPVRIGVSNFFQNVSTPVRYVNCLLQGKGQAADIELRRFLVNTTVGVLGFGDPARDQYGLEPTWEDLGQTLGVHGMDSGFYIVWPIFGPSTVRDSFGMAGDMFLNPVRYVNPWETSVIISATRVVNEGSFHIGEYEEFKSASLEPYIAMREAYIQYRDEKIQQ